MRVTQDLNSFGEIIAHAQCSVDENIYIYIYIYIYIPCVPLQNNMSDNLPERVQILCHVHIICITVLENRIICCQIFCNLLLKSAFERIFNVMQLILVKTRYALSDIIKI
jgi:hypothetical protein